MYAILFAPITLIPAIFLAVIALTRPQVGELQVSDRLKNFFQGVLASSIILLIGKGVELAVLYFYLIVLDWDLRLGWGPPVPSMTWVYFLGFILLSIYIYRKKMYWCYAGMAFVLILVFFVVNSSGSIGH